MATKRADAKEAVANGTVTHAAAANGAAAGGQAREGVVGFARVPFIPGPIRDFPGAFRANMGRINRNGWAQGLETMDVASTTVRKQLRDVDAAASSMRAEFEKMQKGMTEGNIKGA